MNRYHFKKRNNNYRRQVFRLTSLIFSITGFLIIVYIFFPLALWQIYFVPVFASYNIEVPIPQTTVVSSKTLQSLISTGFTNISGKDYTNAQNWFPNSIISPDSSKPYIDSYTLSIPKLNIHKANVSTVNYDLSSNLVNYPGTTIPPNFGNAVVFGHSTLPHLFNPKNYKTIFATVHQLKIGDEILVHIGEITYTYKIFGLTVVDADNEGIFSQLYDNSYLTLVTCTPPGTVWKRLLIKASLVPIQNT